MGGVKARPKWASIMLGFWRTFALPAQSRGAKFCKILIVIKVVRVVLDLLAPDVGVLYLSLAHLAEVSEPLAHAMAWYVALWFVRQRDEARAELKTNRARSAAL